MIAQNSASNNSCVFRVIPECQAIMDEHQGRKSEIDAREEKIASVLATGEQMIENDHFASNEVRPSFLGSNFKI